MTKAEIRKKNVVFDALHSAEAMDMVGFALKDYSVQEQVEWLKSKRKYIPQHKVNKILNSRGSYNTVMQMLLLEKLIDRMPLSNFYLNEIAEFIEYFEEYTKKFILSPKHSKLILSPRIRALGSKDTGAVVPFAVAVAFYAILEDAEDDMDLLLNSFFEPLALTLKFQTDEINYGKFLIRLLLLLVEEGFFNARTIEKLKYHAPVTMLNFLDDLIVHATDVKWLNDHFLKKFESKSYTHDLICTVLFFMTRVSTAYSGKELTALPKSQFFIMAEQNNNKYFNIQDLLYLYSAVCCCSEQKHKLVLPELKHSTENNLKLLNYREFFV